MVWPRAKEQYSGQFEYGNRFRNESNFNDHCHWNGAYSFEVERVMFKRKDRDEEYQEYLNDAGMFGAMDREEFNSIKDRAEEIASGQFLGTFERDERVWDEVKKIKEESE